MIQSVSFAKIFISLFGQKLKSVNMNVMWDFE